MIGNQDFSKVIQRLGRILTEIQPDPLRKSSARQKFLDQAALMRAGVGQSNHIGKSIISFKQRAVSAVVISIILAVGLLSGTVYASNSACPGDFLYPVDRVVEQIQLNLTFNPYDQVGLLLTLTEERVDESQTLVNNGNIEDLPIALGGYYELVDQITESMSALYGDASDLQQMVDSVLSVQEQTLADLLGQVPEEALPGINQALQAIQGTHTNSSSHTRTATATPSLTTTSTELSDEEDGTRTPTLTPIFSATQPGNAHANQTENTHRNNDISHTPQGNGNNK